MVKRLDRQPRLQALIDGLLRRARAKGVSDDVMFETQFLQNGRQPVFLEVGRGDDDGVHILHRHRLALSLL